MRGAERHSALVDIVSSILHFSPNWVLMASCFITGNYTYAYEHRRARPATLGRFSFSGDVQSQETEPPGYPKRVRCEGNWQPRALWRMGRRPQDLATNAD